MQSAICLTSPPGHVKVINRFNPHCEMSTRTGGADTVGESKDGKGEGFKIKVIHYFSYLIFFTYCVTLIAVSSHLLCLMKEVYFSRVQFNNYHISVYFL